MKSRQVLEAVLFVAESPVSSEELAEVLEVPRAEVEDLLVEMQADLIEREAGTVLIRAAGGWRLYSNPDTLPYLERFATTPTASRISAAALGTLAVVAYRQPIARSQVSEIRGVDSESVLSTLERRGLIEEIARSRGPGNPVVYRTTDLFLERLGIDDLGELPPLADHVPPPDLVETLEESYRSGT